MARVTPGLTPEVSLALVTEWRRRELEFLTPGPDDAPVVLPELVKDVDRAVVLVEPRAHHPDLEHTIAHWARVAHAIDWGFLWITGPAGARRSKELAEALGIVNLNVGNLPLDDLTVENYNAMMLDPGFWGSVPVEHIWIVQTDAIAFGPGVWPERIAAFEDYGYVGAPWWWWDPVTGRPNAPGAPLPTVCGDAAGLRATWPDLVGNGGCSLRRKTAMLRALARFRTRSAPRVVPPARSGAGAATPEGHGPPAESDAAEAVEDAREVVDCHNEDVFYANVAEPKCPRAKALRFAVETVCPERPGTPETPTALAMHRAWDYLPTGVIAWFLRCASYAPRAFHPELDEFLGPDL